VDVFWLLKTYSGKTKLDSLSRTRVIRLLPGTLRKVRTSLFEKVAPNKPWVPAGLRHSYCSAMINSGKSIDQTCLALGHQGSPTILHNHYFLAAPKEEALAYWQIMPEV
jgi:hypothetical protein